MPANWSRTRSEIAHFGGQQSAGSASFRIGYILCVIRHAFGIAVDPRAAARRRLVAIGELGRPLTRGDHSERSRALQELPVVGDCPGCTFWGKVPGTHLGQVPRDLRLCVGEHRDVAHTESLDSDLPVGALAAMVASVVVVARSPSRSAPSAGAAGSLRSTRRPRSSATGPCRGRSPSAPSRGSGSPWPSISCLGSRPRPTRGHYARGRSPSIRRCRTRCCSAGSWRARSKKRSAVDTGACVSVTPPPPPDGGPSRSGSGTRRFRRATRASGRWPSRSRCRASRRRP